MFPRIFIQHLSSLLLLTLSSACTLPMHRFILPRNCNPFKNDDSDFRCDDDSCDAIPYNHQGSSRQFLIKNDLHQVSHPIFTNASNCCMICLEPKLQTDYKVTNKRFQKRQNRWRNLQIVQGYGQKVHVSDGRSSVDRKVLADFCGGIIV